MIDGEKSLDDLTDRELRARVRELEAEKRRLDAAGVKQGVVERQVRLRAKTAELGRRYG